MRRSPLLRRLLAAACLAGLALAAAGCGTGHRSPVLVPPGASLDLTPVVLVPGVTGTALEERQTGRLLWGDGRSLFLPRDGGYRLALPLGTGLDDPDRLEPAFVLEEVRLGPLTEPIYSPVLDALAANGFTRGDLTDPRPDENLFAFAYDWRRDNTLSARVLLSRLEELARVKGKSPEDPLEVSLVCQSNGAHVCRWLAKYGAATLEEAEEGVSGLPPWLEIERIVLIGTANGGALRILRELDRGRSYVPFLGLGRKWRPEVLFTFPSLYQDLSAYQRRFFVDGAGILLDVDLFDAADWARYGFSAFAADVRQRLARRGREDLFGTEAERVAFLQRQLDRALRFRALLDADPPGFVPPALHSIQNVYAATADRAALLPAGDGFDLVFTGDRELRRRRVLATLLTAPGDGHATLDSQLDLSPLERRALAPPLYVTGDHFTILHHPATEERVVRVLTGLATSERAPPPAPSPAPR